MEPDVVTVRWPDEASVRDELAAAGRPRLLLVGTEAAPPVATDPLEDWCRCPVSELDLSARIEGLRRRAAARADGPPTIDEHGCLRHAGSWVSIPPVEARLIGRMLERFGRVVPRDELVDAGWPGASPERNVLDVHVLRLRRRIEPVHLAIRTVRSRGYVLEQA